MLFRRVKDNFHAAEERLGWLEHVVRDGGPLQSLIEEAIASKAENLAVV